MTEPEQDRKPNILLIVSDEHSFRFQGRLPREKGGEDVETPFLDGLAAQSTVFETAYCGVPLCVPSRITMLTGRYASESGALDNHSVLDPELDTFPKVLSRAGYDTTLVGKMHFFGSLQFHGFRNRPYGDLLGTGLHQYEDDLWSTTGKRAERNSGMDVEKGIGDNLVSRTRIVGETGIPESQLTDNIVAQESVAYLRNFQAENPDKPWFLCASFSRPHFPLTAPRRHARKYQADNISEPFFGESGASYDHPVSQAIREGFHVGRIDHHEMMSARAGYFACVSYLDELLGDMFRQLESSDLLKDTIVIYTSDHGEMAGELGTWWKSGWYEASCRVPLMVSTPEHRRGELAAAAVEVPVSLLDLAPTLSTIAGEDNMSAFDGVDLSGVIAGKSTAPERPVFCDHLNDRWGKGTEFRSVRYRNWKYVTFRNGDRLLFDLEKDPGETQNRISEAPDALKEFFAKSDVNYAGFERAHKARQETLKAEYPLDTSDATPTQFLTNTGLVVAADNQLYHARVHTDNPRAYFADWPQS